MDKTTHEIGNTSFGASVTVTECEDDDMDISIDDGMEGDGGGKGEVWLIKEEVTDLYRVLHRYCGPVDRTVASYDSDEPQTSLPDDRSVRTATANSDGSDVAETETGENEPGVEELERRVARLERRVSDHEITWAKADE